jgi:molybdenum cofactor biosynthesis protein B
VSHVEHKSAARSRVGCFVVTVSDTRTPDTDTSGGAIRQLLAEAGHLATGSVVVRDDPSAVTGAVAAALRDEHTHVVITTGGTGITAFEKRLDGFGELFRMLSFAEIGAAAMLSRATAGTIGRKAAFVLPGSEHAVRLAMTRLILPELGHVVQQLEK